MQARITFYKIENCGFYKYSPNNPPECLFGGIGDVLTNLMEWTRDVPLEETKVHGNIGDIIGTYVSSLITEENHGSYLLVLWNEVFASEAGVLSLRGNSVVGQPQRLIENDIEQGSIPGYPTCFWILPEQKLLATVVFKKALAGKNPLEKYFYHFMRNCSQYVHKEEVDGETVITYIDPSNPEKQTKRTPSFKISPYHKTESLQFYQAQMPRVRKVLVKSTFNVDQTIPLQWYQRLLNLCGFSRPETTTTSNLNYQIELSADEGSFNFEELYERWQNEYDENNIDYGFKLENDTTKYWLSGAVAKDTFDLTNVGLSDLIENPAQVLTQLINIRTQIMSILR